MTISFSRETEAKAIIREPLTKQSGGYRSRGWTPLKYPKSALSQDDESFVYFPLHRDVLLATLRELLILDGTLESKTLKVSDKAVRFRIDGEETTIPRYKRHLDGTSWSRAVEIIEEAGESSSLSAARKRKKQQLTNHLKKAKVVDGEFVQAVSIMQDDAVLVEHKQFRIPLAEDVASVILKRSRFQGTISDDHTLSKLPRKVSEADETLPEHTAHGFGHESSPFKGSPTSVAGVDSSDVHTEQDGSQEISRVLDLGKRNQNGAFTWRVSPDSMSSMLHSSISNEALLRDAAMTMTEQLIETFSDRALKMFFGYKSPSVSREQLSQLLAGLLFDISHAMFAWEQTEQEVLVAAPDTANDDFIQKALFDQRALKKIGGFDSSSILPHAISIARLRGRNSSWERFSTSAQGQKMLAHHAQPKIAMSAGKRRRGHRLRQRYWLTSAYISGDNDGDLSTFTGTRSRSCSFASSEGEEEIHAGPVDRRFRLLEDIPCSKAVTLQKSPGTSWGVCLVKEGEDCVVGRASEDVDGRDSGQRLRCGDMILYAQNESGDEVSSRRSAWLTPEFTGQDYYRAMVNLFKKSGKLQLVVQRV